MVRSYLWTPSQSHRIVTTALFTTQQSGEVGPHSRDAMVTDHWLNFHFSPFKSADLCLSLCLLGTSLLPALHPSLPHMICSRLKGQMLMALLWRFSLLLLLQWFEQKMKMYAFFLPVCVCMCVCCCVFKGKVHIEVMQA